MGQRLGPPHPKPLADEAGLHAGAEVDLSLVDGAIVVRPAPAPRPRVLAELLLEITDNNLPGEWDTKSALVMEIW